MTDFLDELSYLAAGLHFFIIFPFAWAKWTLWFMIQAMPSTRRLW